jgi:hypothetical protein
VPAVSRPLGVGSAQMHSIRVRCGAPERAVGRAADAMPLRCPSPINQHGRDCTAKDAEEVTRTVRPYVDLEWDLSAVHHVVVHPCQSGVGHAGGQRCVARTLRFYQAQRAARQRDNNVIKAVNMLARFCTGGEGPLGYDYAFIFDLYGWNSFHVYNRLR